MSTGNQGPRQGQQQRAPENAPRRSTSARTGTPPRSSRGRTSRQIEERRRAQRQAARRRMLIGGSIVGIAVIIAIIVIVLSTVRNNGSAAAPTVTAVPTARPTAIPSPIPTAPLVAALPSAAEKTASASACAPFLSAGQDPTGKKQWGKAPKQVISMSKHYQVQIYTDKGTITADILPNLGQVAANNFLFLACNGFYDNLIFHRTVPDFMIQGGDPLGTGLGGPGYTIADDKVTRPYQVGDLAMARTSQPHSAGSQFFIIQGAQGVALSQSPTYALFGHVTRGENVVNAIATAPAHSVSGSIDQVPSTPNKPVHIRAITLQVS